MKSKMLNILTIILGLIIIIFPILGFASVSAIFGLAFLFMGFFITFSYFNDEHDAMKYMALIIGIILMLFGITLIAVPSLLVAFTTLFVYIAGLILLVIGVIGLFSADTPALKYLSLLNTVLGIFYLILAYFMKDVKLFGILIGIWLALSGILSLLNIF